MLMLVSRRWWWVTGALAFGCAGTNSAGKAPAPRQLGVAKPVPSAAPKALEPSRPAAAPAGPSRASPPNAGAGARALAQFDAFLKEQPELEYPALSERLGLTGAKEPALSFDPTRVRY